MIAYSLSFQHCDHGSFRVHVSPDEQYAGSDATCTAGHHVTADDAEALLAAPCAEG